MFSKHKRTGIIAIKMNGEPLKSGFIGIIEDLTRGNLHFNNVLGEKFITSTSHRTTRNRITGVFTRDPSTMREVAR